MITFQTPQMSGIIFTTDYLQLLFKFIVHKDYNRNNIQQNSDTKGQGTGNEKM